MLYPSGAPLSDALVRGEVSIAPLLYNIIYTKKRDGAPVEIFFPPEGVPLNSYAAGITKTAANPNAAKLFLNWCLSEEGQTFMIKEHGNLTSLKKPPAYPAGLRPKVIKVWVPKFERVREAARRAGSRSGTRPTAIGSDADQLASASCIGETGTRVERRTNVRGTEGLASAQGVRTGLPAVDDVSFRIAAGEIVVLLGPSGCGKTTTLRCVAGLEHPTAGTISIGGDVVSAPERGMQVPPRAAQHRHGVPVLCGVAAHDGAPERRLSAAPPQGRRAASATARSTRCSSSSASANMPSGR